MIILIQKALFPKLTIFTSAGRILIFHLCIFIENLYHLECFASYKILKYVFREIILNLDVFFLTLLSLQLISAIKLQTKQKIPMKDKL